MSSIECDYLVVGAGASSVSFCDELINSSKNLTVCLVDTRNKPGGHWVDSYPFVRLHQPAAFYGVKSRDLGNGGADLSSKDEIMAYYGAVLQDLMATGRLNFLPHTRYNWSTGDVESLLEPRRRLHVDVRNKIVDGTALLTRVPSTHPPSYEVEKDVNFIPVNGLGSIRSPWERYVIIGSGKTGIDALVYLIRNNVSPDRLRWVVSHDCWYILRDSLPDKGGLFGPDMQRAVLKGKDVDDIYHMLEANEVMCRLDEDVEPTHMRAATISLDELESLRTIKDVVRKGRISRITRAKVLFESGEELESNAQTLYVDCSTNTTLFRPTMPIFEPGKITLQMVQLPQPTYSASVIAALELKHPEDDAKKNEILRPINAPHLKEEWFKLMIPHLQNRDRIRSELGFRWLWSNRLSTYNLQKIMGWTKSRVVGGLFLFGVVDARNERMVKKLQSIFGDSTGITTVLGDDESHAP